MGTFNDYPTATPQDDDLIPFQRTPFGSGDSFSTTPELLKGYLGLDVPDHQILFGNEGEIVSTPDFTYDEVTQLLTVDSIKLSGLTSPGVLHNNVNGEVSSSLIVNADIAAAAGIVDSKLATIATAGKVSNSATTATSANTASAIVARDSSGNFNAGTITASLIGNASTATSATTAGTAINFSGSLSGNVTGPQSATVIAPDVITNAMINSAAAIADSKLAQITTASKVANSATTATNANNPSTIVARDASGNFSAGTITANLSGNATTSTTSTNFSGSLGGDVGGTQGATVVQPGVITNAKLAQMAENSIKGNDTGGTADAKDLTVSEVKTLLGIVGSVTIADTQIGFGDASGNIAGSANFTWNNSTLVLSLANNSEINLGNSLSARKVVLYDPGAGNDFQYFGFGITAGQTDYIVSSTSNNHVFYAATSTSARQELAQIRGNGRFSIGVGTPSASTIFQVSSTTQGSIAMPKMTTTNINNISSPTEGITAYDTTTHQWKGYNGTSWVILG